MEFTKVDDIDSLNDFRKSLLKLVLPDEDVLKTIQVMSLKNDIYYNSKDFLEYDEKLTNLKNSNLFESRFFDYLMILFNYEIEFFKTNLKELKK